MATATRVPLEVYLRSSYEPDAEYVDGEIKERSVPILNHADWQQAIVSCFLQNAKTWSIRVFPELRVQVTAANYRVPDVTVLDRLSPLEQIVTVAPIAVFEVLSPDDSIQELHNKLAEYAQMGVPQIWVIDPGLGAFERYQSGHLVPATRFDQANIQFEMAEIATFLQAPGL